ncbi:Leucine-rich repeat receptor serine/threonine/tyrosine-protein kinase SOBIR1 [Spatholobus suberectus]|nr:Leucine-rich repeat receptor serine/threonine/tyrosine-protein kinase SOBIR1 [Spatholobus suberectus]
MVGKTHLVLFSLFISIHAKHDHHPSDLKALLTLRKNLRINGQEEVCDLEPLQGAASDTIVPKRSILAETPTTEARTGDAPGPSPNHHKHKSSKRKPARWILRFVAGTLAGTISGFIFSLLLKLALALIKGRGRIRMTIYSPLIKNAEDLAFLEKEEGLASLEIIKSSNYGNIYKAELPGTGSNGKMIAIRKIVWPPKDTELAEEDCKPLRKKMRQRQWRINNVVNLHFRHRNLLPLLAHVSRPDCHYLV